jgi:hypothetical protein
VGQMREGYSEPLTVSSARTPQAQDDAELALRTSVRTYTSWSHTVAVFACSPALRTNKWKRCTALQPPGMQALHPHGGDREMLLLLPVLLLLVVLMMPAAVVVVPGCWCWC